MKAKDLMTSQVVTVGPDTPAKEAARWRAIACDDAAIAREVRGHLSAAGRRRWEVTVTDGVVRLTSEGADETDRHIAAVVAGAAPGVVDVRITDARAEPTRR